jgi:hypothetical protein
MQRQASDRASNLSAQDWGRKAAEYEQEAEVIRRSIRQMEDVAAQAAE